MKIFLFQLCASHKLYCIASHHYHNFFSAMYAISPAICPALFFCFCSSLNSIFVSPLYYRPPSICLCLLISSIVVHWLFTLKQTNAFKYPPREREREGARLNEWVNKWMFGMLVWEPANAIIIIIIIISITQWLQWVYRQACVGGMCNFLN